MKRYFEYTDEVSNKFWEIDSKEKQVIVTFGKIGIKRPQQIKKKFSTNEEAKKFAEKKIREKINKGYIENSKTVIKGKTRQIDLPKRVNKKIPQITLWAQDVHIYGGVLVVGDAISLIKAMQTENCYDDYFYNGEDFINPVDKINDGRSIDYFTCTNQGGCWTPVFSNNKAEGIFIDTASPHLTAHAVHPDCFFEKEHFKILNRIIKKAVQNSNPIFTLNTDSRTMLYMQAADEVTFYTEDEIKINYRDKNKIVARPYGIRNELMRLFRGRKHKFINFESGLTEHTLDFLINYLKSSKYEVFKIESLEKDIDWFATYYAKYHLGEKDLYKEKKPSKEQAIKLKEWSDKQLKFLGLSQSLEEIEKGMSKPSIRQYKSYVEDYGFTHGYYLRGVD